MVMGQSGRPFKWDKEQKLMELHRREDSTKWDKIIYSQDEANYKKGKYGFFPTPKYNLVENNIFYGVGYDGDFNGIEIANDLKVIYLYFYFKNSVINKFIFFTIITTVHESFSQDDINVQITSRNHPSYLANGTINNGVNMVSFQSFFTGDDFSYSIINDRIFDLTMGNIIIVVPYNDGSLRSKQIYSGDLYQSDAKNSIEDIIKKNILFLEAEN